MGETREGKRQTHGEARTTMTRRNKYKQETEISEPPDMLRLLEHRLPPAIDQKRIRAALLERGGPKFLALVNMMFDPVGRRQSWPTMIRKSGLTYAEVIECVRDSFMQEGILRQAVHVPQVLEDIAIDSKSTEQMCPGCEGIGHIEVESGGKENGKKPEMVEKVCLNCGGSGKIRVVGDLESRKLLFTHLGIQQQKGPLVDARTVNVNHNNGESLVETLQRMRGGSGQGQSPKQIEGEVKETAK